MGSHCCGGQFSLDIQVNKINNFEDYLTALTQYLLHAQSKLGSYGENSENSDNNILTYEQYQYYISLNNILLKIKMLMEDYLMNQEQQNTNSGDYREKKRTNYENNNINEKFKRKLDRKGDASSYDLSNKTFNLKSGIYILESIMSTEENFDIEKLESIEDKIHNQMFIIYK